MNKEPIYSFLMSGELKPMYQLGIKSFQDNGHPFILYTYLDNLKFDCEIRDLREIFPEKDVYFYEHMHPNFKHGGITERINAEMLYKLGGWHVNLDVTCLKPFDFDSEYVFRPHHTGIVANIIKAPKGSKFAEMYVNWTKGITPQERDYEKSIKGLYPAAKSLGLDKYIVDNEIFGRDEDNWWMYLYNAPYSEPPKERLGIHWCNAYGRVHQEGSFYESLLKKYNIV